MRKKMKHILFMMMSMALATSCSQDALDEGQDNSLPEGKYPLVLTAAGLEVMATPATRGTGDGDWTDVKGKDIPLMDDSNSDNPEVKLYRLMVDDLDNKTARLTSDAPFYWKSTTEMKAIEAWYSPKEDEEFEKYKSKRPAKGALWKTATVQTAETMKEDDFLYVKDYMDFEDRESQTLQFQHLLAKVMVNLVESDYLKSAGKVSVTLTNCLYEGNFDFDEERNMRIKEALMTDDNLADITLCELDTPADGAFATHEGILIPQSVEQNTNLYIQVTVDDNATYHWRMQLSGSEIAMKGGYQYTFNITVSAQGMAVGLNINAWTTGGSENIEKTI